MFYWRDVIEIGVVNGFTSSAFTQIGFMSEHGVDSVGDSFDCTVRHVCALDSVFNSRV